MWYPIQRRQKRSNMQRLFSWEASSFIQQKELLILLLQPEDFSEEHHRLIYEALQTVLGTSALDTVHAVKILLSDAELEHIGGEVYLVMLKQQAESTTMSLEDQAYLLKQASLHSLLIKLERHSTLVPCTTKR